MTLLICTYGRQKTIGTFIVKRCGVLFCYTGVNNAIFNNFANSNLPFLVILLSTLGTTFSPLSVIVNVTVMQIISLAFQTKSVKSVTLCMTKY